MTHLPGELVWATGVISLVQICYEKTIISMFFFFPSVTNIRFCDILRNQVVDL